MEGLEKFREAFEAYSENYVIIGGTACDIAMTGTAVRPRATHDIDMIVIVEKMTADFAEHFWQFVREGGYRPEKRKQSEGEVPKYELYRFVNGKPDYPEMIEDDFYHFTIDHSKLTNGLRHADSAALIALKSRAYLNLLQDKANGKHVNSKDIKKHRSDVLKNVVIMEDSQITAPEPIVTCIKEFVASIRNDWDALSEPLAKALDQDPSFIEALLEQLDGLFAIEQS